VTDERPILDVADVAVSFGAVKAVDGVSMAVPRGSVCGLIGPNGSGKTTFLGAISRFVPLTRGRIVFDDVDVTAHAPHAVSGAGMGRTFQAMHLLGTMTVRENVMVGADFRLTPRTLVRSWLDIRSSLRSNRAAANAADAALERVGMREHCDSRPTELPYGMQRRVEIARALAARPTMLLLDEPVAGMSDEERREISMLVRDLRDEGLTQILVEHDLATIHRVCDLAYVLNFGKVIARGTPADVVEQPAVREAYLGHASLESTAAPTATPAFEEVSGDAEPVRP
jgi:branched-chain amino acid transport system ATP-binding protein